jgi:hypothetical protein
MTDWTIDEELLALQYYADARAQWATVGLVLSADITSADRVEDSQSPGFPEGLSPAEVWEECLEDARGVLAHAQVCTDSRCDCR